MPSIKIRSLQAADVASVETLLAAKRGHYAAMSPIFWRLAADAAPMHELFLQWLVSDDTNLCLTTESLDGVLIATPRDGGWLVDDFAVRWPELWQTVGRALLDEARACLGPSGSVVCASSDEQQRSLLDGCGFTPYEQWWVAEPSPVAEHAGPATAQPGAAGEPLPEVTIGPAPPVYDPGGPVALVTSWDGSHGSLASLAQALSSECALLVISVGYHDEQRQAAVEALGFTVASVWYR